ncbi:putative virion structural protein [Erwinia phage vB_EamM_Caitlin]|uniref:putative virion structural protein n=1 Tax=Erwinia phage vB_EamM_Caitlin TaxID=1883379 RepID=UPI00081C6F8C|nr:putative virion structural protein [Erwinia phage vB_EamM_Caitlin]ANZ48355.1 putative virion structural protein [Erwinia phage vB_EamM_Caitlin]
MAENTLETSVVSFLSKFPDLFRQRADSLEEFNQILYNEYTTLVEQSLLGLDYLPGILEKLQMLMAGNQLTAISLLVGVPEVDVIGTLDQISTRRNSADAAARSGARLGKFAMGESRGRFGLPSYDNLAMAVGESARPSRRNPNVQVAAESTSVDKAERVSSTLPSNFIKQMAEQEGLSQGKQFSATFERNGNKVEVPMRIRLDVKSVPTEGLETIIAFSDQTKDFWDRYLRLQYKGGRNGSALDKIAAAKDLAFSNDLIEEYRKNRFRDKTGYYSKMMEKRNSNWMSGLLTLAPSINNASGIIVVSQETIDGLEAQMGGSFDDFNVRQRIFQDTLTVYYVVVDTTWNRVTIYTRGMNGSQELDKSDFSKSKSGSADVNKIIEAYRSGAQPVL